jgi:Ca-activated chloride channel family protein
VANIAPGEDIDVVVRYVQDLTYDAGAYEFVFPMVVGPRFIPGAPMGGAPSGTGWAKDTDAVRDASRVSPPLIGGGQRAGHDISLELVANPGFPITEWEAVTHAVSGEVTAGGVLDVMLAEADSIPNRDFVLRYKVGAPQAQASLLTHYGDRGGFFALMVQPPDLDLGASVGARELVFVCAHHAARWPP